ncbi:MAG: nitroreductase family protein, partial [Chloroflexota bacterium]
MTIEAKSVTENIHLFLRTRRSVRRFKSDPVPASTIERILETAIHAPSAHNLQPWRFAVLQGLSARRRLGQALTAKMHADMTATGALQSEIDSRVQRSLCRLEEAPVVILLCRD